MAESTSSALWTIRLPVELLTKIRSRPRPTWALPSAPSPPRSEVDELNRPRPDPETTATIFIPYPRGAVTVHGWPRQIFQRLASAIPPLRERCRGDIRKNGERFRGKRIYGRTRRMGSERSSFH